MWEAAVRVGWPRLGNDAVVVSGLVFGAAAVAARATYRKARGRRKPCGKSNTEGYGSPFLWLLSFAQA